MKLNSGKIVLLRTASLLNIFMLLEKRGPYRTATCASVLVFLNQMFMDSKTHRLVKGDLSLVNEETGELNFSVLARLMMGDTKKAEVKHADEVFKLSKKCVETVKLFEGGDGKGGRGGLGGHYVVDEDGEEVATATVYFKQIIREMLGKKWMHYSQKGVKKLDEGRGSLRLDNVVEYGRVTSENKVGCW